MPVDEPLDWMLLVGDVGAVASGLALDDDNDDDGSERLAVLRGGEPRIVVVGTCVEVTVSVGLRVRVVIGVLVSESVSVSVEVRRVDVSVGDLVRDERVAVPVELVSVRVAVRVSAK